MTVFCIEEDCKTRASYNYFGQKPNYCFTHKKDKMVNVVSKLCIGCNTTRPCYNKSGLKPLYCVNCKEDDMIDVINKKCIDCNESIPNFNYKGLKPLYCFDCKEDDMIDVKNKMCIDCNQTIPSYNYPGSKPLYCVNCKENDMIDIRSKMCIKCNKIQPSYNKPGLKPLYCTNCKEDNMIDVRSKMCIFCNKTTAHYDNYKYCGPCNAFVNPESIQGKKYRFKQNTIVDILKKYFIFDIIDKQIDNGCSDRKPDLIIDCLTHIVNIEIDEDQHKSKSYTPECERRRYDEIFTAFADRPLICIRFNPDKYILKENNIIWNIEGIFKNTKIDEKELDERIKLLINTIKENIINIPLEIFKIEYLFYDK